MKISSRLKNSFEDAIAGHITMREIERLFENNDIENKINEELPVSGVRRSLTKQYYKSINWDNEDEIKNALQTFADILSILEEKNQIYGAGDFENPYTKTVEQLKTNLSKDGLEYNGKTIILRTLPNMDSQESKKDTLQEAERTEEVKLVSITDEQQSSILQANTATSPKDDNLTVFISYSWDDESHKNWVLKLANDLINNGVNVLLDRFELKAGRNMAHFMENSVGEADYVLCILTPNYKTKANDRTSGVGFEYSMISQALFDNQSSGKFIPILRRGNQATSTPNYLNALIYHDMSEDSNYGKSFEELLRIIYKEPAIKKPILGKKPTFAISQLEVTNIEGTSKANELSETSLQVESIEVVKLINRPTTSASQGEFFDFVYNEYSVEIKNISSSTISEIYVDIIFPIYLVEKPHDFKNDGENCIITFHYSSKVHPGRIIITDKFILQVTSRNYSRALNATIKINIYSELDTTFKEFSVKDTFIVHNNYGQKLYLTDTQFR